MEQCEALFDIGYCKCASSCSCPTDKRVPKEEKKFLNDQRKNRNMFIGEVDRKNTARMVKIYKKTHSSMVTALPGTSTQQESSSNPASPCSSPAASISENSDSDYNLPPCKKTKVSSISLESIAIAADRTNTSHRSTAIIASATLQAHGIVSNQDCSKVIDKSQIFRARTKVRTRLSTSAQSSQEPIGALFFYGKKDDSLEH